MFDLITIFLALKETPLPSILAIAGLIAILISYVKIDGRLVIEDKIKPFSMLFGFLLLVTSVAIFILPEPSTNKLLNPDTTISPSNVSKEEIERTATSSVSIETTQKTNEIQSICDGTSWANCWQIDDNLQTITWVGFANGVTDIAQDGLALQKIKAGYTAIVNITVPMQINICTGTVDGKKPEGNCPKIFALSAGTHEIIAPGESGGFRIYP